MSALAAHLPPLPPLQPGEAAQLVAWAAGAGTTQPGAAGTSSSSSSGSSGMAGGGSSLDDWASYGPAGRPLAVAGQEGELGVGVVGEGTRVGAARGGEEVRGLVVVWGVAACCLRCLRQEFVVSQVLGAGEGKGPDGGAGQQQQQQLVPLQLRCVLAACGHVSNRELMAVRSVLTVVDGKQQAGVSIPYPSAGVAGAGAGAAGGPEAHLLVLLCVALAGTPQTFQVGSVGAGQDRRSI